MDAISKKLYTLKLIKNGTSILFFMSVLGFIFDFEPIKSTWVYLMFSVVFIAIRTYELKLKNELFTSKTLYTALYYVIGFILLALTVYYLSN